MIRLPLSIAIDHPAFEGHFPAQPIVPGVVLLDLGLRALAAHGGHDGDHVRIGAAKFLSMVRPGEPVRLEVEPSSTTGDGYRLQVFAGVGEAERLAVSGHVVFDAREAR